MWRLRTGTSLEETPSVACQDRDAVGTTTLVDDHRRRRQQKGGHGVPRNGLGNETRALSAIFPGPGKLGGCMGSLFRRWRRVSRGVATPGFSTGSESARGFD